MIPMTIGRPSGFLGQSCREGTERPAGPNESYYRMAGQQQQFCQSTFSPNSFGNNLSSTSGETCSCSECASTTSTSSDSTSSSSSETGLSRETSKQEGINPLASAYYNYEFCTCDVALPEAYVPKEKPKKKPKPKGPQAGIWCGSPCCAVAEYFPVNGKSVKCTPLPIKPKSRSSAIPPGTCCYRNDQVIFQMPNKGAKGDSDVLPFYSIGQDEQPLGVKMIRPEENPELDPDNNTFLLKISKTDPNGKPAKLQLALKIPRPTDNSVSETEKKVQYDSEDLKEPEMRRKSRKSGRKSKASLRNKSRKSKTRGSRRSTKRSTTKSTNKVKFSGLKSMIKDIKQKEK